MRLKVEHKGVKYLLDGVMTGEQFEQLKASSQSTKMVIATPDGQQTTTAKIGELQLISPKTGD